MNDKIERSTNDTVLLIHGTFANKRCDWWIPDSLFCRDIDALLQDSGAEARCWAHCAPDRPFAWTGKNSESARRVAGLALAAQLEALESDRAIRRYHLVGHSHGGNVILNALRELDRPSKLAAVIFLGTPVLTFRHRKLNPRWVAVPVYLALIAAGVWIYLRWPANLLTAIVIIVSAALALTAELAPSSPSAPRDDNDLYGSGQPSAFVFKDDEAITVLEIAQQISDSPRRFIDKFAQTEPAPSPAFRSTAAPRETFSHRLKNTAPYRWLMESLTERPPVASPILHSASAGVSSAPKQAASEMQVLKNWASKSPFHALICVVVCVCALLPLALTIAVRAIYEFLIGRARAVTSAISLASAKGLGRIALPVLVQKAAFGADQGKFVKVSRPSQYEVLNDISAAETEQVSRRFEQDVVQAIRTALLNGDAFEIKTQVKNALTNSKLVHSHYYQSREVKERIAKLIWAAARQSR